MTLNVVGVIHAKGTSKRVPSKNLRKLDGEPLFTHAIRTGLDASAVDLTVIDSDSEQIRELGADIGAEPLERPNRLASNEATGDDLAYWQASNFPEYDILVQIVPTSPFIRPETVNEAINLLQSADVDSVTTIRREALYEWESDIPVYFDENAKIPNSFELGKTTFETTALYATTINYILDNERRLNPNSCTGLEVNQIEAVDIDTKEDLLFARLLAAGMDNYYDSDSATWRDDLE
jgi:CMP-N-acetylneuraminic acid synthetase